VERGETAQRTGSQTHVSIPSELAELLAEVVQRQQQIEGDLNLTENRASAQLDADTSREQPLAEPDADSLKEGYERGW
jgi:hypothetical protein